MKVVDLRLPKPLHRPQEWTKASETSGDAIWILPLDLACAVGGLAKSVFEELVRTRQAAWFVSADRFSDSSPEKASRRSVARKWLERSAPHAKLCFLSDAREPGEIAKCLGLSAPIEILSLEGQGRIGAAPSSRDWLREIAPRFSESFGADAIEASRIAYALELPEAESFPFEGFRFFSGFLRRRGEAAMASAFAREWAHLQALHSPQDESGERKSLRPGEVMLNPTLQIVRSLEHQEPFVDAWTRMNDSVHELRFGVAEAALIDETAENFRIDRGELLAAASRTTGISGEALEAAFAKLVSQSALLVGEDRSL